MITVTAKEKISMYLIEYYFGFNKFITPLRIVGGPFFILLGFTILYKYPIENSLFYVGFSFILGFFVILRPYLQIAFRLANFKTEEIELNVDKSGVTVLQNDSKSKIKFNSCVSIKERKKHIVFILDKINRVQIPKDVFEEVQYSIIRKNLK